MPVQRHIAGSLNLHTWVLMFSYVHAHVHAQTHEKRTHIKWQQEMALPWLWPTLMLSGEICAELYSCTLQYHSPYLVFVHTTVHFFKYIYTVLLILITFYTDLNVFSNLYATLYGQRTLTHICSTLWSCNQTAHVLQCPCKHDEKAVL